MQRLAHQALAANAGGDAHSRIRSAASVHAQVPVAMPASNEGPLPELQAFAAPREMGTARFARAPEEFDATSRAAFPGSQATSVLHQQIHEAQPMQPAAAPQSTAIAPQREAAPVSSVRELAVPQCLLDEVTSASSSPPAIAPVAPAPQFPASAAHSTASAEPTEVHVHIGRIEVTAVHEPAAPRKKSAPTPRQTQPLADYLARRRRS